MSWRFARQAKWVVRHVLVVVLVVVLVNLGFWQLSRLDERRAEGDRVEARTGAPVVPVTELAGRAPEDVEHRRVTATGRYLDHETVVVANRTDEGRPGGWVLTPLEVADGRAVVVGRGFVGFDRDGELVAPPAPPGDVTVAGLVQRTQQRGRFGPRDPSGEDLDVLARVDLERYQEQVDAELLAIWVQATTVEDGLVPLPEPETDDGPHLSYAVQWFTFATIAAGGYLLLLRKVAIEEGARRRLDRPAAEPDDVDRELQDLLRSEGR